MSRQESTEGRKIGLEEKDTHRRTPKKKKEKKREIGK